MFGLQSISVYTFICHQQLIHFEMPFTQNFIAVKMLKTCIAIHLYVKDACMKSKRHS
jgi:hypothetical protein